MCTYVIIMSFDACVDLFIIKIIYHISYRYGLKIILKQVKIRIEQKNQNNKQFYGS